MKSETTVARPAGPELAASLALDLAKYDADSDRTGRFGGDALRAMTDAGLLMLNVPAAAGGIGESLSGTVETLRTIAQGSGSAALMLAMHTSTLSHFRLAPDVVPAMHRPEYIRQQAWAFDRAGEGHVFAVANTEPGAGGNVKNSRAEIRDNRIFGTKSFCSMGLAARYFMAAAREEGAGVEYYLVENDPSRVAVQEPWNAVGMRGSDSVTLRFDGAPVLGPLAYSGLIDGANNRHWATLSFTAVFIGIAESLLKDVRASRGGMLLQTAAVDLHLAIQASLGFLRHCVETEPQRADDAYRRRVRDCKLFVTRALVQHATQVVSALGGSAYRFDSPVSRKLRDLMAGPAVRPPVGVTFEELWSEIAG